MTSAGGGRANLPVAAERPLKDLTFFIFQTYHVNIPVCFLSRLGVHLPPRGHFIADLTPKYPTF